MMRALCMTIVTTLSLSLGAAEIGKIVVAKGEAQIELPDGKSIAAKPLSSLEEGFKINTGNRGYVKLLMNDDSVFQVGPNSAFTFEKYQQKTKQERTAVYSLAKGQLRSWFVHKAPEKTLTIKTPTAAMGIRGTEILTDVYHGADGEIKTDIALIRGKLEVDSKAIGESVVMVPGQLLDGLGAQVAGRAPASARAALLKRLPTKVFEAVRKNSVDQEGSIFLRDARQKYDSDGNSGKVFSSDSSRLPASSIVDKEDLKFKRSQMKKHMRQVERRRERSIAQESSTPIRQLSGARVGSGDTTGSNTFSGSIPRRPRINNINDNNDQTP